MNSDHQVADDTDTKQSVIRRTYDLLARAYPEKAGAGMEIFIEQCVITAEGHFATLVPDAVTLAVVDALSRKRKKHWVATCAYAQSIIRGQIEAIRLDQAVDPPRYHYTRLVGPKPHGMPGYEDVRLWNDGLLEWRQRGGRYFVLRRCESHPIMFARAVGLARQSVHFAQAVGFDGWETNLQ